jgi:acetylornithine deacetylase/succinyl-diaminopimelate desuccinylase-like protein
MSMSRIAPVLLAFVSLAGALRAQPLQEKVRAWRVAHERELMDEYRELVAIPNTSIDRANIRRNADFLVAMLKKRGVDARLLTVKAPNSNPYVFGEVKVPGATRTIMLYAHFDGMPVNPAQWAPGWEPFTPKFVTDSLERGGKIVEDWKSGDPINPQWRLTGRGVGDDKAGAFAILNAYAALQAAGVRPSSNLKFIFEGEEEISSIHLGDLLDEHHDEMTADLWVIADGPCHVSGKKLVALGVRGDVNVHLTVYAAKRPLHSGNYGNWAPNPAGLLVNLLASMKDDDGHVLIKGFYDDVIPLTDAEKRAIAAVPSPDAQLAKELGLARPEQAGRTLLEGLMLPTLNINGIASANVGPQAANIIPTTARAVLDLRLVLGNDVPRQIAKVVAHIESRGWHVIDHEPTDTEREQFARLIRLEPKPGYNAQRTPLDAPLAQAVVAAVQSTVDYPVVQMVSQGGSLPLVVIEQKMGAKVLAVAVSNYDNNQHAENENVVVQFLWNGIETYAALLTMR